MIEARFVPLDGPWSASSVDLDADLFWHIITTNVRAERKAAEGLARKGLGVYCPVSIRSVIRNRRKCVRVDPLLSRYIFVGFRPSDSFWSLRGIDGIEAVLRFDGEPVRVPQAVVAEFVKRELSGEFDETREKRPLAAFNAGQVVGIIEGPFCGLAATVANAKAGLRVQVLLDILGGQTLASFEAEHLRAVE